jgi:hypothetical protein
VSWFGPKENLKQGDQPEKEKQPSRKKGVITKQSHPGAAKNMDAFDNLFLFVIGLLLIEFLAWLEGLPNALTHLAPAAGA